MAKTKRTKKTSTINKRKVSSTKKKQPRKKQYSSSRLSAEKFKTISPAKIKVVGVGGAGGNVITRMSVSPFRGVEFIAVNTDIQDLNSATARKKIHIGKNLTRGLGTGMNPELGRRAAEESLDDIAAVLDGADMIFITAGMGGGTGSGSSPVIAEAAQKTGALTIGVVTKPFFFEGSQRAKIAEDAAARLREKVDALITVPNDKIFSVIDKDTSLFKAFEKIDDVLRSAVQGISELVTAPGIVNVDFADVRAVMEGAGTTVVGIGASQGKERALSAAKAAITSPLLETSIEGAKGVLFSITGGRDIKMTEINDAAKFITETADPGSRIIFGAYNDRRLKPGVMKITVLASGFNGYGGRSNQNLGLFGEFHHVETDDDLNDNQGVALDLDNEIKGEDSGSREENKIVSKLKKKKYKEIEVSNDSEEDVWDIPAFLRKKKRRK